MHKSILFFLLQCFIASNLLAQSYTIDHFQSTYDTLVDYGSVTKELGEASLDLFVWERSFDFGFEFPFFNEKHDRVIMDNSGMGSFPGAPDYNLFFFAGWYSVGIPEDTAYLKSEVRYDYLNKNQLDAFVLEYHDVYVIDEYDSNGANHYINFQTWFFEDGTMEVHFGPIDLDSCSYYFPGKGFSFDNQDSLNSIYGPWLAINNNNLSKGACFSGNHNDPDLHYNDDRNCNILTSIPPDGYVVRFVPSQSTSVPSIEQDATDNCTFSIRQENNVIHIADPASTFQSCTVYDLMGRVVGSFDKPSFQLNLTAPTILLISIESDCGTSTQKLMLNSVR